MISNFRPSYNRLTPYDFIINFLANVNNIIADASPAVCAAGCGGVRAVAVSRRRRSRYVGVRMRSGCVAAVVQWLDTTRQRRWYGSSRTRDVI